MDCYAGNTTFWVCLPKDLARLTGGKCSALRMACSISEHLYEIEYLKARGWRVVTRVFDMGGYRTVGWGQVLSKISTKATGNLCPGMMRSGSSRMCCVPAAQRDRSRNMQDDPRMDAKRLDQLKQMMSGRTCLCWEAPSCMCEDETGMSVGCERRLNKGAGSQGFSREPFPCWESASLAGRLHT